MNLEISKKVCTACKARCCYFGGPTMTLEERNKILDAGNMDHTIENLIEGKLFYDVKDENGKCPYLGKNNLCTIHEVRPSVCKTWPVESAFKGEKHQTIVLDCPLTPYLSKNDLEGMKQLALTIPKELFDANQTGLTPEIKQRLNVFGWDQKQKEAKE